MDKCFLSVGYNNREIPSQMENFSTSIEEKYLIQFRPKFIAAAAEGGEIWLDLFLNLEFYRVIGLATAAIAWDILSERIEPLRTALDFFAKRTKENPLPLNLQSVNLVFTDLDISLPECHDFNLVINLLIEEVSKRIPEIEKLVQEPINKIVIHNTGYYDEPNFLDKWEIGLMMGGDLEYDVKNNTIK